MFGVTERTREESQLSSGRYLNIRCAKQSSEPFGSCFIRSSSETFILFMETVHEIKLRWKPPEIWRHVDANLLRIRGVYCLPLQDKEEFSLDYCDCALYPSSAVKASNCTSTVGLLFRGNLVPVQGFKAYVGVEIKLHSFLTSALEGGEW